MAFSAAVARVRTRLDRQSEHAVICRQIRGNRPAARLVDLTVTAPKGRPCRCIGLPVSGSGTIGYRARALSGEITALAYAAQYTAPNMDGGIHDGH